MKTFHPKPYPYYKPSDVEWLGDIPTHWKVARLKGQVANVTDQTSERGPDEIYIALEHVESWTGKFSDAGDDVSFDSQVKRFQVGDVLFGKLRPYLAKVTSPRRNGICVGEFLVLRCLSYNLVPGYLEHLLRSKPIIDAIDASTFGAKMPRADWNFIGSMRQPLPPLAEQTAVVRYLDQADERIRRYVSSRERLIELLEEYRQAIIHHAVTRGLDPDVRLKPSGVEWLGDVPVHWEAKRLKTIGRIRYGLGQPPRELADGLPLIRATNVDHGRIIDKNLLYIDPLDVPSGRDAILREKEIIVVRSGAYTGDSAIVPKAYDGAITGYDMVVSVTGAQPEFVAMTLLCKYVRDDQLIVASTRSAQPHLNAEELGTAILLVPPLSEQAVIVAYLDKATADIDAAIDRARREIELLGEYRTRLIADVVTGQVDVREAAAELSAV